MSVENTKSILKVYNIFWKTSPTFSILSQPSYAPIKPPLVSQILNPLVCERRSLELVSSNGRLLKYLSLMCTYMLVIYTSKSYTYAQASPSGSAPLLLTNDGSSHLAFTTCQPLWQLESDFKYRLLLLQSYTDTIMLVCFLSFCVTTNG